VSASHEYHVSLRWTGNLGSGTRTYRAYARDHEISSAGKPPLLGSADPKYRGDAARYNPEDLLVASLSSCHMLWYLHLAAERGVVVEEYTDQAGGTLELDRGGSGQFTDVVLRPAVAISSGDPALAQSLHEDAHEHCFIAKSVNFPVRCEPTVQVRRRAASAPG
jgi:organic hydroperoxide reductase OsmC/OhrA